MEKRTAFFYLSLFTVAVIFMVLCLKETTSFSNFTSFYNSFFPFRKNSTETGNANQMFVQMIDPLMGFRQALKFYSNTQPSTVEKREKKNEKQKESPQTNGSFVIVSIGNYATVWHGASNSPGKLWNETKKEWITFPCPVDKIKPWMEKNQTIETKDLFSRTKIVEQTEFQSPPGSRFNYPFPPFGKKTERHSKFKSAFHRQSSLVNQMDEYASRSEYGDAIFGRIVGEAYITQNHLFGGSHIFDILAYDSEAMNYRVEDHTEYEMIESSNIMESCDIPTFRTQSELSFSRASKIVTPLGNLGTLQYTAKGSSDSSNLCKNGKTTSSLNKKGVNPRQFWRVDQALHTDNIIIQIYVLHALKGYEHHSYSIYDNWWGEALKEFSDDFIPTSRIELIQCALDMIDDTQTNSIYLSHQSQTANIDFQMAVEQLIRFYYKNGNLSDIALSKEPLRISVR